MKKGHPATNKYAGLKELKCCCKMENMDLTQAASSTKSQKDVAVLIRTFRNSDSSLDLQKTLAEIRPNYIVMYHSNVTAIRNIEVCTTNLGA